MQENYEKITRDQHVIYLDVTPKENTETWKLLGFGITNGKINYNPQMATEKWIINKNSTSSHESNQKQMDVNQKCYKNEPCFEYMNGLRDKTGKDVQGHALEIDLWNGKEADGVMKYPAKKSDCVTPVTSYMDETAVIEYSIYFNGDPIEGTVTIVDKVPVFTPNA